MEHQFTATIMAILNKEFDDCAPAIFSASPLLAYLNIKTRAASRGSKSRASFGNLYALYVLVEDYVSGGFHNTGIYSQYEGASFTKLFKRQRELPFGRKLQNHHLNTRLNDEFKRFFPATGMEPISRDGQNGRYWIKEGLLVVDLGARKVNVARAVLKIIDAYVCARQSAFETFISDCKKLQRLERSRPGQLNDFIQSLLSPSVDARIFEIVSYAILKQFYAGQCIYWGWTYNTVKKDHLILYKTGRTNANDGGIDFVMKPLGRFFQVTETVDARKYFLDIDKVQRFPITFVVKSNQSVEQIRGKIETQAMKQYGVQRIVRRYMESIEEIINVPDLMVKFADVRKAGRLGDVIGEITLQSKVEFNYD
jgi:hypothetical protein